MARAERSASGFGAAFDAEYEALPEGIKLLVSPREFAWTEPENRARLIEQECLPDVPED